MVVLSGRYDLGGLIRSGGMGEVREGWDTRLCRPVAIKLLHPALGAQPELLRRFVAEARAAARINHPNIVAVHDFGQHDGAPFIVMERLPGHTLGDLTARGPVAQPLVRRVLDSTLAALGAAHSVGVLHRDIKPGNILFTSAGDVKVADFGVAKTAQAAETQTGQILGTMAYISPERLAGAPASVTDDIYAVGVVGYEALTGRRPFPQDDIAALARAITDSRPAPLIAQRPDADPALAAAVTRAMAKDRQARFGTAEQMRSALWESPRPATKVFVSPPFPAQLTAAVPVRRRLMRNRAVKLALVPAVAAVVGVTALAFAADPSSQMAPQPAATTSEVAPPPPPVPPPPTSVSPPPQPQPPPAAPPGRGGKGNKKGHD